MQPLTKEEEGNRGNAKLGGGRGLSSSTRGGSQGVTGRGKFIPLSSILPSSLYSLIGTESSLYSLAFYLDFLSLLFQGLWPLQQASQFVGGGMEVRREGTLAGDRGVEEDEGSSGRIRGRRFSMGS